MLSRLTRDGIAEPVPQDQILRRERRQGKQIISPVQLTTSRLGNLTRLILTLVICDDHTYIIYIHMICTLTSRQATRRGKDTCQQYLSTINRPSWPKWSKQYVGETRNLFSDKKSVIFRDFGGNDHRLGPFTEEV